MTTKSEERAMTERVKGASFLIEETDPQAVFTPEDFTEEHKMIASTTEEFVENEVLPVIDRIEQDHDFATSVALMRKAGELGLLGGDVPEAYGGLGLDKISTTIVTEKFARARSFSLTYGAHVGIGTLPIVFFGTEAQKKKYLPDLAAGKKIAAYALTEPGSGSDALGAKTTATLSPDGTHYILNGEKQWITNAGFADVFVVYAKVDGDKFSAFIVERAFPGVSTGAEEKKMGIEGSSTRTLILQDARVPVENLLGEVGRGHVIAFNILNIGRWKLAAGCVGSAKRAVELSAQYAKQRKQFGRPIASFPLIQQKLADMAIRTYVMESMVYRTAGLFDGALGVLPADADGQTAAKAIADYAVECSVNKVFATEALDFIVDEGVQIHGGYGYMREYEIENLYRGSRINRIFEGTNEINRLLIPDMLVKKALRGELALLPAAQALQQELVAFVPTEPGDAPLEREADLVRRAKKLFLFLSGLAVQKHQQALEREQELLAAVADCVIEVFAMESALLRAQKAIARDGLEKAALKVAYTQAYVQDAFDKLERIGRTALAALEEGDALRAQLAVLRKLVRRTPLNAVALKRQIAARVLEAERYVS
ncbi:acyl-CoA dehydrogenase family protein [Calditerricola satsumensis]|uniref:Putative acyl-CoA dehydrogenase n=1 Tax=Calditerricola satsumensis TaxID=373054 RepID=A0A8J3B9Z9_9BACI|nr:acyl-CoA dehydrogenase family protein [Calditerricola satsumensis]GGK05330.1 putative acyl-CoA dehydrogenase [Calditerricola satsumensis]